MKDQIIEFRIADFAAMLLKAFKPILCATLIFAVVGGCFGFYRSLRPDKFVSVTTEDERSAMEAVQSAGAELEDLENTLRSLKNIEIPDAEKLIAHAEQLVESRQEYVDNSIYYALDPFRCGVSRLLLHIESDGGEAASDQGSAQNLNVLLDEIGAQILSENSEALDRINSAMKTQVDAIYLKEIISLSAVSNQLIEISVLNSDPKVAEEAVNYLLEAISLTLSEKDPRLTCELVDRFAGFEINWDMYDQHLKVDESLVAAEQTLTSARESFLVLKNETAKKELAAEDAKTELASQEANLNRIQRLLAGSPYSLKNAVKWTFIFAFLFMCFGLFIACFVTIVHDTTGGKVQNQNMILSCCDLPLLGVLPSEKKRPFEKAIRRLEGESLIDYQSALNAVAQTILTVANGRSACLISSLGCSEAEVLLPYLEGHVQLCGDIIDDSESEKKLASHDSVILVEKKGASNMSMIDREVQRVKVLNKDLLGIVLI